MTYDEWDGDRGAATSCFVIPSSFVIRAWSFILSDTHAVPRHQPLREIVDPERDCKKDQAHHEKRAVMGAAAHYFAHLLRNNSRHRVDRLERGAKTLREIGNRNPVPRAEQHNHRFPDHASQ